MTSEQIAELRNLSDATPGYERRLAVYEVAIVALLRVLDEREALLAAARAIYPEDAPVRTGAWKLRALADAIAKAESP